MMAGEGGRQAGECFAPLWVIRLHEALCRKGKAAERGAKHSPDRCMWQEANAIVSIFMKILMPHVKNDTLTQTVTLGSK